MSKGRENVVYWCMSLFLLFTFSLPGFLSNISFFSLIFLCIPLFSILSFLPLPSFLYCSWLPLFIPSIIVGFTPFFPLTVFGSLWVPLKDYPLACRLLSHYLCSKYVGYTTPHSQIKLLVMFLTFLYSFFTHMEGLSYLITYLYDMHQMVSDHTYFFWVKCHSKRAFLPKKLEWEP